MAVEDVHALARRQERRADVVGARHRRGEQDYAGDAARRQVLRRRQHHRGSRAVADEVDARVGAALGERRTRGHFGDDQAGPELGHQAPKRSIGYSRHRRQNRWVRQRQIADDHRPEAGKRHHWRHLASLHTN